MNKIRQFFSAIKLWWTVRTTKPILCTVYFDYRVKSAQNILHTFESLAYCYEGVPTSAYLPIFRPANVVVGNCIIIDIHIEKVPTVK